MPCLRNRLSKLRAPKPVTCRSERSTPAHLSPDAAKPVESDSRQPGIEQLVPNAAAAPSDWSPNNLNPVLWRQSISIAIGNLTTRGQPAAPGDFFIDQPSYVRGRGRRRPRQATRNGMRGQTPLELAVRNATKTQVRAPVAIQLPKRRLRPCL